MNRRGILTGTAALSAAPILGGASEGVRAQTASRAVHVPGALRWRIGDIDVIAIHDGYVRLPLTVLPHADRDVEQRLRRSAFLDDGDIPVSINTFLIRSGGRLALVDTGAGNKLGRTAGSLLENLRLLGVRPEDISTLLLTHLHSDHVFGLTGDDGKPAFPSAEFVVSKREADYWLDDANLARVPEFQQRYFAVGRAALQPYAQRTRMIAKAEEEVFPGVTAVPLYGHTAGHTGYRIASGGDQLLIWGDIVHMPHVQFAQPAWGIAFDTDPEAGMATRKRTFDMASSDRILVAGMHTGFPGFGHVTREKDGYGFLPATWQPNRA